MGTPQAKIEMRAQRVASAVPPSERVRAFLDDTAKAWEALGADERSEVIAALSRTRGPLDAGTIQRMLDATGSNISVAAKQLGVARFTLQRKMRAFGMPLGKAGRRAR